ncbi:MAG: adenylate/guanylate cyclase domain-containing protein [Gammaproteobacteria bacterium]
MKHENFETLSLTELIRLQNELSEIVVRRFETNLALLFSDIVKSTEYFVRFGNEAGYKLQRRHFDLLDQVVPKHGGRIVDTAGDGGFSCFATVEQAAEASVQLQLALCKENINRERDHQLVVRIGMHYGPVLTDNVLVTGDAVNLCARVAAAGEGAEIRLTREAFAELSGARRVCCRALAPIELKGIGRPVPTLVLEWRDPKLFPTAFRIEETSSVCPLPSQDIIGFGRLRENNDMPANDVVLTHPDPNQNQRISRWQFELRRDAEGLFLRQLSDTSITEVDGATVTPGMRAHIRPGTEVRVGRALTLRFLSGHTPDETFNAEASTRPRATK